MDGPDLAPATRKRKPAPAAAPADLPAAVTSTDELTAHIHAIESAVRGLDARVELLERLVRNGFQEVASRALVLSEATDEALTRVETRLAAMDISELRSEVGLVAERLSVLLGGPSLTELMDRIDEIADRGDDAPKRRRK